ncbi:hypothetical protein C8R47DRAFT_1063164 [Mycena vitilis]|nr:hypothetical protein C8R47DRAFT_1063164 [Mycena vitilis]
MLARMNAYGVRALANARYGEDFDAVRKCTVDGGSLYLLKRIPEVLEYGTREYKGTLANYTGQVVGQIDELFSMPGVPKVLLRVRLPADASCAAATYFSRQESAMKYIMERDTTLLGGSTKESFFDFSATYPAITPVPHSFYVAFETSPPLTNALRRHAQATVIMKVSISRQDKTNRATGETERVTVRVFHRAWHVLTRSKCYRLDMWNMEILPAAAFPSRLRTTAYICDVNGSAGRYQKRVQPPAVGVSEIISRLSSAEICFACKISELVPGQESIGLSADQTVVSTPLTIEMAATSVSITTARRVSEIKSDLDSSVRLLATSLILVFIDSAKHNHGHVSAYLFATGIAQPVEVPVPVLSVDVPVTVENVRYMAWMATDPAHPLTNLSFLEMDAGDDASFMVFAPDQERAMGRADLLHPVNGALAALQQPAFPQFRGNVLVMRRERRTGLLRGEPRLSSDHSDFVTVTAMSGDVSVSGADQGTCPLMEREVQQPLCRSLTPATVMAAALPAALLIDSLHKRGFSLGTYHEDYDAVRVKSVPGGSHFCFMGTDQPFYDLGEHSHCRHILYTTLFVGKVDYVSEKVQCDLGGNAHEVICVRLCAPSDASCEVRRIYGEQLRRLREIMLDDALKLCGGSTVSWFNAVAVEEGCSEKEDCFYVLVCATVDSRTRRTLALESGDVIAFTAALERIDVESAGPVNRVRRAETRLLTLARTMTALIEYLLSSEGFIASKYFEEYAAIRVKSIVGGSLFCFVSVRRPEYGLGDHRRRRHRARVYEFLGEVDWVSDETLCAIGGEPREVLCIRVRTPTGASCQVQHIYAEQLRLLKEILDRDHRAMGRAETASWFGAEEISSSWPEKAGCIYDGAKFFVVTRMRSRVERVLALRPGTTLKLTCAMERIDMELPRAVSRDSSVTTYCCTSSKLHMRVKYPEKGPRIRATGKGAAAAITAWLE